MTEKPEVGMVRVGKNHYMSEEEALQKGYAPRLDPPIKGEPFLAPEGILNFITVVASVAGTYWFSQFLRWFLFGH